MSDRRYDLLCEDLTNRQVDVQAAEAVLGDLHIETPSWGYSPSGTRFGAFPEAGAPRTLLEKLDDAAEVHRHTGSAPAVALHIPWDAQDDYAVLRAEVEDRELSIGAINPNLFQAPEYKLGSVCHRDATVRRKAADHLVECAAIARELGSSAISVWLADGLNYAGQDDLRRRRRDLVGTLQVLAEAAQDDLEVLIEYKPFEPAFYATDIPDWGSAVLICQELGPQARVLVDLGHHLPGANVEQIVVQLDDVGRLGGFHFNGRRYADDDLIVGSANPFELFCIFSELALLDELPRLTIDQAFVVERPIEGMVASVVNLQEAYAKALVVERRELGEAQRVGDVVGAQEVLRRAFATDVRPLCAKVREEVGASADPLASLRASEYLKATARQRPRPSLSASSGLGT